MIFYMLLILINQFISKGNNVFLSHYTTWLKEHYAVSENKFKLYILISTILMKL